MSTERWIRLNTSWSDSEWLYDQPPAVRLAWIEMLCYIKRDGILGRAKAIPFTVAASKWRVPKGDIEMLCNVAVIDLALRIEDGDWIIKNWARYQGESAGRVRLFRQRKEAKETETLTETETETETGGVTSVTAVTLQPLRNVTQPPDGGSSTAASPLAPTTPFSLFVSETWKDVRDPVRWEAEIVAVYPAGFDYLQEVKFAHLWILNNPKKAPHDHKRFFGNWLKTTYERWRKGVPSNQPRRFSIPSKDDDEYVQQLKELGKI